VFLLGVGPHPYPGEFALLLSAGAGLEPFPPLLHSFYRACLRGQALVPLPGLVLRLNLFSVLCGALAVAGFHRLLSGMIIRSAGHRAGASLAVLMAAAGAGALAVSLPVWFVCTRAHYLSFDLMWLIVLLLLTRRGVRSGRMHDVMAASLVCGVGVAEWSVLALLAPLWWLYLALMSYRRRATVVPAIACAVGAAASGLAWYAVSAALFLRTPAAEWRGFTTLWEVIWYTWRDQWLELRGMLSARGSLALGLTCVLPFGVCALAARQKVRRGSRWSFVLLLGGATALNLLVLFNGPGSPWQVGGIAAPAVTTSLLASATFAMLTGLWCVPLIGRRQAEGDDTPVRIHPLYPVILAGLLAATAARHLPPASARQASVFHRWISASVDVLEGRQWLVSGGFFDSEFRLESRRRGQDLFLLSGRATANENYLRQLVEQMPVPGMSRLTGAGLIAVLREWAQRDPAISDHLAFQHQPDGWFALGLVGYPVGPLYLGSREPFHLDGKDLLARQKDLSALVPSLQRIASGRGPLLDLARALIEELSRMANNLGAVLEKIPQPVEAESAYRLALEILPSNLSAAVNLHDLTSSQGRGAEAAGLWDAVRENTTREELRRPLPALVQRYGHVAQGRSLERLQELAGALPAEEKISHALGDAVRSYVAGDFDTAFALLETHVREQPEDAAGWTLYGVTAYRLANEAAFQRSLLRTKELGRQSAPLLVLQGHRFLAAGDGMSARRSYEQALAGAPALLPALEAILQLDLAEENREQIAPHLRSLLEQDPGNAVGNLVLGLIQHQSKESALAEESFRRSVARKPLPLALNNLAWLLQERGALEEALPYARQAIELAPENPKAWDTLARVLRKLGREKEATEAEEKAKARD